MNEQLKKAAEIVSAGGVIIFPTDTACGIGCRIDNQDAVQRIFQIKGREASKAPPILFSSMEMVHAYVTSVPKDVEARLMNLYWPGALTIVLEANMDTTSELVRGGGSTIGVRIPGDETIRSLIDRVGVPIIGTSANFSGNPTVYATQDCSPKLVELVDYVLPGECAEKQSSTVIDCTQKPWKILREGSVTLVL